MSSEFLLLDLMKELNITTKDLLTAEKAFLPNGKLSLKVVICIDGKDYLTDDIDILRKDSYLARGVIIGNYFFSFKNKWQEEKTQIPCNQMEKLPTKEQVMILSENYEKYKALAKFCKKNITNPQDIKSLKITVKTMWMYFCLKKNETLQKNIRLTS